MPICPVCHKESEPGEWESRGCCPLCETEEGRGCSDWQQLAAQIATWLCGGRTFHLAVWWEQTARRVEYVERATAVRKTGSVGQFAGSVVGGVLLGPLGAAIGGAIGGASGPQPNEERVVRTYGRPGILAVDQEMVCILEFGERDLGQSTALRQQDLESLRLGWQE